MKKLEHPTYFAFALVISPVVGTFVGRSVSDIGMVFTTGFDTWVHNLPALTFSNAGMAIFGIIFSLPVVLLYGVPVFFLLKWLRKDSIWMFGLFGALPTTIGTAISWFRQDAPLPFYAYSYSHGALTGISVACFFWFIAVYLPSRSRRQREANKDASQIG